MANALDQNFTLTKLLSFAFPSIINLFLVSVTVMVDSLFVANYVGVTALAAVNLAFPLVNILTAIAFVISIGGSAIIAKTMGEGKNRLASERFTFLALVMLLLSLLLGALAYAFADDLQSFLGASTDTAGHLENYLTYYLPFIPAVFGQLFFYFFLIVAGKPGLSFVISLIGSISNIALDYLFVAIKQWGTTGAALGTGISILITVIIGSSYFAFNKHSTLKFVTPKTEMRVLTKSLTNGSSEGVDSVSGAIIAWILNITMLKLAGESGVAAIGIIEYLQFLLLASLLGFTTGIAPIISYNYGAKNQARLQRLVKQVAAVTSSLSVIAAGIAAIFPKFLVGFFVRPGTESFEMAVTGLRYFALALLFLWISILFTETFTALNNGLLSAVVAFARTFVFLITFLLVLPKIWGVTGVWIALPATEILSALLAIILLLVTRRRYQLF